MSPAGPGQEVAGRIGRNLGRAAGRVFRLYPIPGGVATAFRPFAGRRLQQPVAGERGADAGLARGVERGHGQPQLAGARERLEDTRLRAPTDGVVVGLQVHTVGGVVRPGESLMEIVPTGQELIIEAQVKPEDADDLRPGQTTEVRITAFGGRNVPIVHGVLRQISADRFTDEHSGRGYFLARVAVPQTELRRLASPAAGNRRLRAGLPAQIIVPTRKRTALQYLVEPLNQALWQSLREQ